MVVDRETGEVFRPLVEGWDYPAPLSGA
jgi:hypothetical protein